MVLGAENGAKNKACLLFFFSKNYFQRVHHVPPTHLETKHRTVNKRQSTCTQGAYIQVRMR